MMPVGPSLLLLQGRVSELCAFFTAIDEALAHAADHSEHEVQGIGAERFFGLKLSGDRGNGPPDTAQVRGTARQHRQSQSSAGASKDSPR